MLGPSDLRQNQQDGGVGHAARRSFAGLSAVALAACLAPGAAVAGSGVGAGAVGAGTPPSYGQDFVTITHAGNRAALPKERFYSFLGAFPDLGRVNYEYRIARTETTVRQWFDFVNVAWPFAQGAGFNTRFDSRFLGGFIEAANANPNAPPNYYIPGPDPFRRRADNVATSMSLRFAAWYVNWTHHGQPTTNLTLETFTTGAYDAATLTRQPGARYWIPSLDEWTKAVYYDPNRYGPGQEGYWQYSGVSTVPLVGGPPGTPGAQSSAGAWYMPGTFGLPPDVGSYLQTVSPWGLLDTSGGVAEFTDTRDSTGSWAVRGDYYDTGWGPFLHDKIDWLFTGGTLDDAINTGLRIASVVPTPGGAAFVIPLSAWTVTTRRRPRRASAAA